LELLSVMAVIIVLAALLLPALENVRAQAKRAQCVSRLREVGVGFQNFAHDHNGQYPMAWPVVAGGTFEFAASGRRQSGNFDYSYRHFQALSAELVTPKLLVCPADTRQAAVSFRVLQNSNVSYFVGLNASYSEPDSLLAGDRNLTNDWAGAPSLVRVGANYSLRWTRELHRFKGNCLFSDGRVEEKNSPALVAVVGRGPAIAELALPTVQPMVWGPPPGSGAPVLARLPARETASPGSAGPSAARVSSAKPIGGPATAERRDEPAVVRKSSGSSDLQPGADSRGSHVSAASNQPPAPGPLSALLWVETHVGEAGIAGGLLGLLLVMAGAAVMKQRRRVRRLRGWRRF